MKLRELMMADMSSKQAYQAAMIQQHAASRGGCSAVLHVQPGDLGWANFGPGWN